MKENAIVFGLMSPAFKLDEDQRLVAEAQKEPEAGAELYEKYYEEILRYLFHSTMNHAIAEDLTSNVFLAAFRHLGRFRWRRIPFRAWLYRIATNEVRMYYRRHQKVPWLDLEAVVQQMPSDMPNAEECLVALEEYGRVHQALLELHSKYRTVIILRFFENKSVPEIAEITGRSQGTIKSQLHRALCRLQAILSDWGIMPNEYTPKPPGKKL